MRSLERRGKRWMTKLLGHLVKSRKVAASDVLRADVRTLLLIRQHNQMGDMVLSLPALRAWRRAFPCSKLVFLTAPICEELLEDHPDIDELMVFRKQDMWVPRRSWAFLQQLRRLRPDLAVVMGSVSFSTTSALLAWLSGARLRVGASSQAFGSDLSRILYHYELADVPDAAHEIEHNLAPLRHLGLEAADLQPFLPAPRLQRPDIACVVLHVGAGKRPNIWPAKNFADLGGRLLQDREVTLALTQGPADAEFVQDVRHQLLEAGVPSRRIVVWQKRLAETVRLVSSADLVISNDTGMAHVAAATGVACVVLFGPTDARRWRPHGRDVEVIVSPDGTMQGITVEEVFAAARKRLRSVNNYR